MTVSRLIKLFSTATKPVEVTEVRDQIVEWGFHDAIIMTSFDGPPGQLLGMLLHYESVVPYGTKQFCIIRYNQNMSVPLQRLVCVKELVHSMDDVALRVSTKLQLILLSRKSREWFEHSAWSDAARFCTHEDSNLPGRARWIFTMRTGQMTVSEPTRQTWPRYSAMPTGSGRLKTTVSG